MKKRVLDVTAGGRMMWFDKQHPDVIYSDRRDESHLLCDGRVFHVQPDIVADFTNLPFPDETFYLVVFDPPHVDNLGENSWMAQKYGKLFPGWEDQIKEGFNECMRVLKKNGTLIFKWSETRIPVGNVVKAIGAKPLFGHPTGKASKTIWMTYMK